MLKKQFNLVLILLFFIFILVSCQANNLHEQGDNDLAIKDNLTLFGGSVGGVWSIFSEGVSEAVRKEYPGTMISAVPGTVAGNSIAVSEGKADFAISESLIAYFAYDGTSPFEKEFDNIRAVAAIMPINVFQLVAPTNAPFNSVVEIGEKQERLRYSAGEVDALGDIISAAIFAANDMSYKEIETNGGEVSFFSGGKTFELMADDRINSLGKMVPVPAGDILEASATIDMKMIPIGEKSINHLVKTYGVTPYTIKAGSYDFQTEDYETVNTPTILITNEEVDEKTVYQITEAIYNQLDYLSDVHNGFKEVNKQTIINVGKVPLHPGAEKFFKEQGLLE